MVRKIKLNLGCGIYLRGGFINVDVAYDEKDIRAKKGYFKNAVVERGAKYVKADIRKMPFPKNYADYVEIMNTIEHIPFREVVPALKEIRRVMKKGAKLVILTNNMDGLVLDWLEMAVNREFDLDKYIDVTETIFGNQRAIGEYHLCPFNPAFMNTCLVLAGFKKGEIAIIPKEIKTPTLGTVKPHSPKSVTRNELLYVEAVK